MIQPGDIVTVDFAGVVGVKRRPAIVISTEKYHSERPDVILAILTTQTQAATTSLDYILQDWEEAGLHRKSAFRAFLFTTSATTITPIGHCSARDWKAIQERLARAIFIEDITNVTDSDE